MDAVLSAQWLSGSSALPIYDVASVGLARAEVRDHAARLGLSAVVGGSLVNIVSELAHNQLAYARHGQIAVRAIEREGTPGLEIIAADQGDGIVEPAAALAGTSRKAAVERGDKPASLGIGLAAVCELADEVDFDVRRGEGTCIWARKFARSVPRRREVGIYGRPCPGEYVSGDQATFVRDEEVLIVGLVDGLGHGPFARSAADLAVSAICEHARSSFDRLLSECHALLQKSRGAVLSAACIQEPLAQLDAACVGNVALQITGLGQTRRVVGASWVLGTAGPQRKATREQHQLGARDVVVLFSDGLSSRFDLSQETSLLVEHPIVIAHQLLQRFARDNDDALVLVAR
jgi:anti-sigma regulatory factor (Ser/Thr protein kinase)